MLSPVYVPSSAVKFMPHATAPCLHGEKGIRARVALPLALLCTGTSLALYAQVITNKVRAATSTGAPTHLHCILHLSTPILVILHLHVISNTAAVSCTDGPGLPCRTLQDVPCSSDVLRIHIIDTDTSRLGNHTNNHNGISTVIGRVKLPKRDGSHIVSWSHRGACHLLASITLATISMASAI